MKKKKNKSNRFVYMIRTKPKYRFPLTEEEQEELHYFIDKVYNPPVYDWLSKDKPKNDMEA